MHSAIIEGGERRNATEYGRSVYDDAPQRSKLITNGKPSFIYPNEKAKCDKCGGVVVLGFHDDLWNWEHM